MKQKEKPAIARRDVLRALAAVGGVAAASTAPFATDAAADTESYDEKRKARYKDTEHVKAFYRVNQYPR